jgi:tetratricopeptide (TPR) repeat protein
MLRYKRFLAAPLCLLAWAANAQLGGDLQAQILYAYHSEDTNQLTTLVQTMSTQIQAGNADSSVRYHLAHAEYRLGLLADATHARGAGSAFSVCVEQLKTFLQQEPDSVEALALQSVCYSNLARFSKLEGMLLRSRAAERLDAAAKLAPHNPRVVYLEAVDALGRAKPGSAESKKAYEELQHAVQLFEMSSATSIEEPGWGHAEAYLDLGRQLQSRGDVLGARNWIEKSLIVAPNYKAAQRQLATLIQH